jgi:glycosyltransferase involved in cell wall biosynthesis
MRIACVINSLGIGGAEKRLALITGSLAQRHDVTIYLLEKDVRRPVSGRVVLRPLSQMTSGASATRRKVLSSILAYWRLRRAYRSEPPDVSISCLEPANTLNLLVTRKAKTPTVLFVSSFMSHTYVSGLYGFTFRTLIRRLYKRADLIVTNSRLSREDLVKNFGVPRRKVSVSYNPVDISRISRLARSPLTPAEESLFNGNVVITVGRLTEAKGQWYLIRAFREVKDRVPDARLVIVGDGELRGYLERVIARHGLQDSVFLVGDQENPYRFLARARVFAFPSVWEGFPNALLESLVCGIPVIAADCRSGPREILAPMTDPWLQTDKVDLAQYGVLTPPVTRERLMDEPLIPAERCLADAIVRLMADEKLHRRYAAAGKRRVKAFAERQQLREVISMIEQLRKGGYARHL